VIQVVDPTLPRCGTDLDTLEYLDTKNSALSKDQQQSKQPEPDAIHRVPVKPDYAGPRQVFFNLQWPHGSKASQQYVQNQPDTADEVRAVQRRRQIKESAARVTGEVNTGIRELAPSDQLRRQKRKT